MSFCLRYRVSTLLFGYVCVGDNQYCKKTYKVFVNYHRKNVHINSLMLIQNIAIIMLISSMMMIICYKLKQPLVLGYIIAGVIIGPHTPPLIWIYDEISTSTIAELGVIFLLFYLGLEFNLRKLNKVYVTAFIVAFFEINVMICIGYGIGKLFAWSYINSIFLGAIISISSTSIIAKTIDELKLKNSKFAHLIFGILVVEDMFAIVILALLSTMVNIGHFEFKEMLFVVTKFLSFLLASLLIGILVIPRLFDYIEKYKSKEMYLILTLGICFSFCLLVLKINYSTALGAFIIGAIISESKQHKIIKQLIFPIRDVFCIIFFVSIGMMFDPAVLVKYFVPIIVITLFVVVGKVLTNFLGLIVSGEGGKIAMRTSLGLVQIGEFSLIISSFGLSLKIIDQYLYSIAVSVSVITTLITPYLIKNSNKIIQYSERKIPIKINRIFKIYYNLIKQIKLKSNNNLFIKKIKKQVIYIAINFLIIISIFLCLTFFADSKVVHLLGKATSKNISNAVSWGIALLFSLPFLITAHQKTRSISKTIVRISFKGNSNLHLTFRMRKIISETISIFMISAIMFYIVLITESILPSIELLIFLIVISVLITFLLFSWLVKLPVWLKSNFINMLSKKK